MICPLAIGREMERIDTNLMKFTEQNLGPVFQV
jgi:hypothetical protein